MWRALFFTMRFRFSKLILSFFCCCCFPNIEMCSGWYEYTQKLTFYTTKFDLVSSVWIGIFLCVQFDIPNENFRSFYGCVFIRIIDNRKLNCVSVVENEWTIFYNSNHSPCTSTNTQMISLFRFYCVLILYVNVSFDGALVCPFICSFSACSPVRFGLWLWALCSFV